MNYLKSLMILFFAVLIWSAINPHDYFTWFLEVLPALIGLLVLVITFQRFRFTNLVYGLILVHCWILMVGGHYTYAEVPLFNWIKQVFDLSRNNYDKVGHLVQGFVPAMITREILVRKQVVNSRKWINVFVVSICMSISVTYEFIEWLVAVLNGDSADSFLGTQGYIWDTQSDMLYATIGAILALVTLGKAQDRVISSLSQ